MIVCETCKRTQISAPSYIVIKFKWTCKWNLKNSRIKYHYIKRTVKQKIDYNKQNKYYNNTDDKQGQIW